MADTHLFVTKTNLRALPFLPLAPRERSTPSTTGCGEAEVSRNSVREAWGQTDLQLTEPHIKRTTDHTLPAPRELSPASAQIWRDVIHDHEFEAHELPLLVSALRWRDKSTAWLQESEEATGREQARLVKQSLDAAQTSLRHWRALKFTDPEGKTRRPGRPAGDAWSPKRRQQARVHQADHAKTSRG